MTVTNEERAIVAKPVKPETVKTAVVLEEGQLSRLRVIAVEEERSVSFLVRMAITLFLRHRGQPNTGHDSTGEQAAD